MKMRTAIIYALMTVAIVILILPAVCNGPVKAEKASCRNNLNQIGYSLYYSMDETGEWPVDLVSVLDSLMPSNAIWKLLQCPVQKMARGNKTIPDIIDYEYVRPIILSNEVVPMVWDKPGNHHYTKRRYFFFIEILDEGGNILFSDGHVKWYNKAEYDEFIKMLRKESNHGLESTSAPPAAGTLETHP